MDLLLTHGFFLAEDPKELQIMKPYAPLGILYLASHLRARNFDVQVFDTTFSSWPELQKHLTNEPQSVLGVYANLMTRGSVIRILRAAKDAGWKTVVGGPEPGAYAEEYLAAGADVVAIGEGELTLEELLPILRSGSTEQLSRVNGIAFRGKGDRVERTPPRAQIPEIDGQPWPSRESISIERYLETWRRHHGTGSISLITARGCPYECKWCSHDVYGKTHRRRRAVSVVDELEWILGRYNPDMLWFADDVFTIHHGWLAQFAAEMKRRGLSIPFECISRADRINERVADLLAELNCFRIWIGSESGSQRVLDAMRRGVTVHEVQSAIALCKARGIQTGMFLMWGYNGEEREDIEATIDHVKVSDPDIFLTTVAYPIRGTAYFQEVQDHVISPKSWGDSSDRDFQIRGRHSRRYYQNVDRLLRAEVELDRTLKSSVVNNHLIVAELRQKIQQAQEGMKATVAEVEVCKFMPPATQDSIPTTTPFDSVAEEYDTRFANSSIGRAQRESVWLEMDRLFSPGQRILEINCGTGVDALHLVSRRIHVVACDASPDMMAVAQRRLIAWPERGHIELRVLGIEQIGELEKEGLYDGVLSNFSGLNCVADLPEVARNLARLVVPGGRMILCLFGRFCLWEMLWYTLHGDFKKAFRRLERKPVIANLAPGHTVLVRYPSLRSIRRSFAPHFRLLGWKGAGIAIPPSYLEPWANRLARLFKIAVNIDPFLGRYPGFRALADHVVLAFERVEV